MFPSFTSLFTNLPAFHLNTFITVVDDPRIVCVKIYLITFFSFHHFSMLIFMLFLLQQTYNLTAKSNFTRQNTHWEITYSSVLSFLSQQLWLKFWLWFLRFFHVHFLGFSLQKLNSFTSANCMATLSYTVYAI